MFGYFGFIPQEVVEAAQAEQKEKKADAKATQEAADKKTPEEQLFEAKECVRVSGRQFCGRILGMLDRETGKLTDQFTILEGHEKEVARIVTKSFLIELDIEMRERGYIDDEE